MDSVHDKFVEYNTKDSHRSHVCNCSLTNKISSVICRYVYTKSYSSNGSLVIAVKLKAEENFRMTVMLLSYILHNS
jgi:hypothetical protein